MQRNRKCDDETVEKMKKVLSEKEDIVFFFKIQRLIEKKSNDVVTEINVLQGDSDSLTKRIAWYTKDNNGFRLPIGFDVTHNMEQ